MISQERRAAPWSGMRLFVMDGGTLRVPLRVFKLGQGLNGEEVDTPIIWFVLIHPRGTVIVDGGNASEAATDALDHWGAIAQQAKLRMRPDQAVLPALQSLTIDPTSVRWIVQTHLHLDHTGALAVIDQFPNAEVLVTRTEFEWAHTPTSVSGPGYCQKDFVKTNIPWSLLEVEDDGYDVFGDCRVRCWRTPGHSPGHQSIEVRLDSGATFLLAGDAANSIDHLEERAFSPVVVSAPEALRSVRRLRRLAWRSEATVITGHDQQQWKSLRHSPAYYD